MTQRWTDLHALAGEQHGLVSWEQATTAGFSRHDLAVLLAEGVLEHPDVRLLSLVAPEPVGPRAKAFAAQLSILRDAVISHLSALWLHGLLRRPPDRTWVTVRGKWAPVRDDVRVVSSRNLPAEDVEVVGGLARTTIERTLCDVASVLPLSRLRGLLLDARQRGLTDEALVADVARRRVGARGIKALLRICEQVAPATADSELEQVVRDWLRTTDLPAPAPDAVEIWTPHGTKRLDIAWPHRNVGAECDGLAYHGSRSAHDSDAIRRTALNLTTWRIVHVTWNRMDSDRAGLHRDLALALAMGGRPS